MAYLFLCYPGCSTCAKAKAFLEQEGISYSLRNIKEENPTASELADWIARSGLPSRRFFNTSGLKYRELGLKDRLPQMPLEEQIALLSTDGMLVKRPLLISDDLVLVGFSSDGWMKSLK